MARSIRPLNVSLGQAWFRSKDALRVNDPTATGLKAMAVALLKDPLLLILLAALAMLTAAAIALAEYSVVVQFKQPEIANQRFNRISLLS